MLDIGIPLSLNHTIEQLDEATVFIVDNGVLIACFSEKITVNIIHKMAIRKPDYILLKNIIFADSLFVTEIKRILKSTSANTSIRVF